MRSSGAFARSPEKTETQKAALDINDAISEVIPLVQQEVIETSGVATSGTGADAARRVR